MRQSAERAAELVPGQDASPLVRAEVAALLRLGAPMMATQFFIMAMGFLDTAMAGHYSSKDLAGVALGGALLWPTFMLVSGFSMAVTPITAQLVGAGLTERVGIEVRQCIMLGLACSAFAVLLVTNASGVFALAGADPGAAAVGAAYLDAAAWGLPPAMAYIVLRFASEGLGHTLEPMLVVGTALALNALLNWVFIYGKFGFPELGGEGCGVATALVMWFELAAMTVVARRRYMRLTGLWASIEPPSASHFRRILKIGVPVGFTSFVGMALFSVVSILIGRLGNVALAAHTIAGHINWATFVAPMAIGGAASIRIGFFVGAKRYDAARASARVGLALAMAYALVVMLLLVLLRFKLAAVYTNDAEVIALAGALILFIAVYQVFDDAQAVIGGSLRGYKDTFVPMLCSLLGYWLVALPLGWALGFGWLGLPRLGVYGFWIGLAVGLGLVASLMAARLRSTSRSAERIRALSS